MKRKLKESLVLDSNKIIPNLLPGKTFNATDAKSKEEMRKIITDLVKTLNNFYEKHNINWKLK